MLRILLTLLIAPVCMFGYDIFVALYEHHTMPVKHNMLGFSIGVRIVGWFLVLLLPVTSWLGDLWWKDRRRYLFNLLLLIALSMYLLLGWSIHPLRTLLLLSCCWATLPLRLLIDSRTLRQAS
ncbi:MAG: hypothetical protein H6592_15610 [Flavobacteriales bacterium]|nr:hypothetical protein [Flavobacteriales bacterium]